jgi:hypothetical protein
MAVGQLVTEDLEAVYYPPGFFGANPFVADASIETFCTASNRNVSCGLALPGEISTTNAVGQDDTSANLLASPGQWAQPKPPTEILCPICIQLCPSVIEFPFGVDSWCYIYVNAPNDSWFDPTAASAFKYTMTSGSLFTSILNFPTGFSNPFIVSSGGKVLGAFSPGQSVIFPNGGVSDFTISAISPTVDPSVVTNFPLKLAFNTATAGFMQRNVPANFTTTASGLAYSRVSHTFNGTVTITNTTAIPINGPLQLFFTGMRPGVALANATGSLPGTPYLTVPLTSIAAGQSVTVGVQFRNPSNATINFTPVAYSGSIN